MDDPAAPADFDVDALLDAVGAAGGGRSGRRPGTSRSSAAIDAGCWPPCPLPALGGDDGPPGRGSRPSPATAADPVGRGRPIAPERARSRSTSRMTARSRSRAAASASTGAGRIVDGGDFGDTLQLRPAGRRPPRRPAERRRRPADRPRPRPRRSSTSSPATTGRSAWRRTERPARTATAPVEITTRLELRTGEPFVRVSLSFTNPSRDHRVRWHLPLAGRRIAPPRRASSRSSSAA